MAYAPAWIAFPDKEDLGGLGEADGAAAALRDRVACALLWRIYKKVGCNYWGSRCVACMLGGAMYCIFVYMCRVVALIGAGYYGAGRWKL